MPYYKTIEVPYQDWSSLSGDPDTVGRLAPLVCGGIYEARRYEELEHFTCIAVIRQKTKVFGRFQRYGMAVEQYEWTPERASGVVLVWAPPIPHTPWAQEVRVEDTLTPPLQEAISQQVSLAVKEAIGQGGAPQAQGNGVAQPTATGPKRSYKKNK